MDVFERINVKDLLPGPESHSSPLSAPDLRLLISRLDSYSLEIKSTVQSFLLSHQADFSSLFERCADLSSRSERLYDDIGALLNLISDHPIEADVARIVRRIVQTKREAREKAEVLELIEVISESDTKLRETRSDLKNGRVVEAAEVLIELKGALGLRCNGDYEAAEEGEPTVYGILKKQWTDCFEEIQELLLRYMENAVQFDQESAALHVKHQTSADGIDELELRTVLKAMEVAGILDYGLAKTADLIIRYVLTPVVSFKSMVLCIEENKKEMGSIPEGTLKLAPSPDSGFQVCKADGERMYSTIIEIVEFINKFICSQNATWMRCIGKLCWPSLSDLIISNFLSKVVPDDASKLAEFQEIRKATIGFEDALKKLMFISPSDVKDEKLSMFADNIEVHFASRKRIQILAKARNILLESSFNLPQDYMKSRVDRKEHPEDSSGHVVLLFSSEKCVVSEAAKQLMELVHQILEEVCLLPPKVGLEFYQMARSAIVLYEAIIPVKLHRLLDSINQAAVLIHNDCLYLSQEILGLAFEYREFFPGFVKEIAVFVDLATKLQVMAEDVLQRQIQLVTDNLNQAIDGADGFQNTHQNRRFESAKFSIDQVSFVIEKVHIIWEPLLLPSVYKKSVTMILEEVFSRIAKEMLLLDDMAAEETLQLQKLIHLLFEHLSSVLEPLVAGDHLRGSYQDVQNESDHFMLSIRKLRKLAELLDMPLKSITEAWESGELGECNFTASEVEDFIRAIFTDSPLRKECLSRIHK